MKAVLLAGGHGKRLRPLTDNVPKPLIEIAGKPIIEWQFIWLKKYGIETFVILSGHLKEKLINYIDKRKKLLNINVEYSLEEEPVGTAGAIKKAEAFLNGEKEFVVANCDTIINIEVDRLKLGNGFATIALVPLRSTFGIVELSDSKIVKFREKPILSEYWMNTGVYLMSNKILDYLPANGDLEKTTFVELAQKGLLSGAKFKDAYYKGIDSIKDVEEAASYLNENKLF